MVLDLELSLNRQWLCLWFLLSYGRWEKQTALQHQGDPSLPKEHGREEGTLSGSLDRLQTKSDISVLHLGKEGPTISGFWAVEPGRWALECVASQQIVFCTGEGGSLSF